MMSIAPNIIKMDIYCFLIYTATQIAIVKQPPRIESHSIYFLDNKKRSFTGIFVQFLESSDKKLDMLTYPKQKTKNKPTRITNVTIGTQSPIYTITTINPILIRCFLLFYWDLENS
jgi:hypothetical protein